MSSNLYKTNYIIHYYLWLFLDFEDLIFTVSYFFDLNPDAVFYVGYQERSDNHRFMIALLLEQWKFQLEEILIDSFFPEDQLSLLQGKSFLIFKIKRKS